MQLSIDVVLGEDLCWRLSNCRAFWKWVAVCIKQLALECKNAIPTCRFSKSCRPHLGQVSLSGLPIINLGIFLISAPQFGLRHFISKCCNEAQSKGPQLRQNGHCGERNPNRCLCPDAERVRALSALPPYVKQCCSRPWICSSAFQAVYLRSLLGKSGTCLVQHRIVRSMGHSRSNTHTDTQRHTCTYPPHHYQT